MTSTAATSSRATTGASTTSTRPTISKDCRWKLGDQNSLPKRRDRKTAKFLMPVMVQFQWCSQMIGPTVCSEGGM